MKLLVKSDQLQRAMVLEAWQYTKKKKEKDLHLKMLIRTVKYSMKSGLQGDFNIWFMPWWYLLKQFDMLILRDCQVVKKIGMLIPH